ncbi:3'(2'),5'-bisphosphate nucleotidase CysQ [Salininema proteolyticum]|uniref:3'(2'),5-bisphosphonucleoside 3'(2')-phosphohydrolase n=1 Tax=Salininema proteolyticum TaxID=1607685 RepID=A0ABV8TSL4_9ACTN
MTSASTSPSAADTAFATSTAHKAGQRLLDLRDEMGFEDPRALKDAGDRLADELILGLIREEYPADAILSEEAVGEEGRDGTARLEADRVWIIDPLDGTREFSEEGRDDWAVHVALWEKGKGLTAGAIALPAQNLVLSTGNVETLVPSGDRPAEPRIAVSRTRPPAEAERAAAKLGAELVPMGSAGAKIAAVVTGRVDAYVHAGGQWEWDSAAPVAVALAAGWFASRVDGTPLRYNREDPGLPDLVVCRPDMSADLLAAVK